jgi:hypothetical protein
MSKPRTEEQKARRRELDRIRREKKRAEAAAAAKVAAKGLKEKVVIKKAGVATKKAKPEVKKTAAKKPVKNPVNAEIRVIACDPYHALFITLAQAFDIMHKLLSANKVVHK